MLEKEKEIQEWLVTMCANRGERERQLSAEGRASFFDKNLDERGVNLYADIFQYKIKSIMDAVFPLTARLLGESFSDLVASYIPANLPDHYKTAETGRNFANFIALQDSLVKKHPYLSNLADYDLAAAVALAHPGEVIPGSMPDFSEPDIRRSTCPLLNPTLSLRQFSFPLLTLAELIEKDRFDDLAGIQPHSTSIAIYRLSGHNSGFLAVSEIGYQLLESLEFEQKSYETLLEEALASLDRKSDPDSAKACLSMFETFHMRDLFCGYKDVS